MLSVHAVHFAFQSSFHAHYSIMGPILGAAHRPRYPLYYNLAPNEMLVPHDLLEKEFLSLAETEGIADIEELNRILDRAVNLKNFLKGDARVKQVAAYVADQLPKQR